MIMPVSFPVPFAVPLPYSVNKALQMIGQPNKRPLLVMAQGLRSIVSHYGSLVPCDVRGHFPMQCE